MNAYFLPILTSTIKPITIPVGDSQYLTISDLKDLKIAILVFLVLSLLHLLRWVWGWFSGDQKTLKDKVIGLETSNALILQQLQGIATTVSQVKDSQLTESEVRGLVRNELDYVERLSKRRN